MLLVLRSLLVISALTLVACSETPPSGGNLTDSSVARTDTGSMVTQDVRPDTFRADASVADANRMDAANVPDALVAADVARTDALTPTTDIAITADIAITPDVAVTTDTAITPDVLADASVAPVDTSVAPADTSASASDASVSPPDASRLLGLGQPCELDSECATGACYDPDKQGLVCGYAGLDWESTAEDLDCDDQTTVRVFSCPAAGTAADIWGTDTYTDDSSVCTAAVHSDLISFAVGGVVSIRLAPGQPSYNGTTRNGVMSRPYGSWSCSYVFVDARSIF